MQPPQHDLAQHLVRETMWLKPRELETSLLPISPKVRGVGWDHSVREGAVGFDGRADSQTATTTHTVAKYLSELSDSTSEGTS